MPDYVEIAREESPTGDICHFGIKNFPDGKARRFFKDNCPDLKNVKICIDNQVKPATAEFLEKLANEWID